MDKFDLLNKWIEFKFEDKRHQKLVGYFYNQMLLVLICKCTQQVIKWWVFKIVSTGIDVTWNVVGITIVQTNLNPKLTNVKYVLS